MEREKGGGIEILNFEIKAGEYNHNRGFNRKTITNEG